GGYSAAPMVNSLDTILGGLSTSAAHIIDDSYTVSPVANFYFNFVSMFVVAAAVTLMTELVLTKRADQLELDPEDENDPENVDVTMALEPKEKRGLAVAVIGIVACAAILFFLALPADSFLRDESGSFGPESGLMAGIAGIIGVGFFLVGIVYGYATGSIRKTGDIPDMMSRGLLPVVAVIGIVACAAILFFLALPADSFLRDESGSFGPESGLMAGIAGIIGVGFFLVGIVYGYATGSIRKTGDIPDMMSRGLLPFVPV